jgi:hypothetical protein
MVIVDNFEDTIPRQARFTHPACKLRRLLSPLAFGLRSHAARNACFAASRLAKAKEAALFGGLFYFFRRNMALAAGIPRVRY